MAWLFSNPRPAGCLLFLWERSESHLHSAVGPLQAPRAGGLCLPAQRICSPTSERGSRGTLELLSRKASQPQGNNTDLETRRIQTVQGWLLTGWGKLSGSPLLRGLCRRAGGGAGGVLAGGPSKGAHHLVLSLHPPQLPSEKAHFHLTQSPAAWSGHERDTRSAPGHTY